MYTDYFGLKKDPFSIVPNPELIYPSYQHSFCIDLIKQNFNNHGGIWMLTGEVGMGKTTITRALINELPKNIEVAYLLYSQLDELDIYKQICYELEIEVAKDTSSRWQLINRINQYLLDNHQKGKHILIVIEEAQNMSEQLLESIRTLTNLETADSKLVTVLLVGQNELLDTVNKQSFRQLHQRISLRTHISRLKLKDTIGYINFRLSTFSHTHRQITGSAKVLAHFLAKGIPRVINILCNSALQIAYINKRQRAGVLDILNAQKQRKIKPNKLIKSALVLALVAATVLLVNTHFFVNFAKNNFKLKLFDSNNQQIEVPLLTKKPINANLITAIENLQSLWQTNASIKFKNWQQYCKNSKILNCYSRKYINYSSLKKINLPAIIEYRLSDDKTINAVLETIDESLGKATILIAKDKHTVSIKTFTDSWNGKVKILWRAPESYNRVLYPNQRNKALINWLQIQLINQGIMQNRYITGGKYNEILTSYVKKFQSKNGLTPDGVLGIRTIMTIQQKQDNDPILFK